MMTEPLSTLRLLQHADSFFPSGAVAFSYGLETLQAESRIAGAAGLECFVREQLVHRWRTFDWGILASAWSADGDPARLAECDRLTECMTLPAELRAGSKRAGAALLTVHTELGTAGVEAFAAAVERGDTPGHLTVVQGCAWRGAGMTLEQSALASVHSLVTAMLGAAVRLSVIGHLSAQRVRLAVEADLQAVVSVPPPDIDDLHSYTPEADIAVMRHQHAHSRLFSS